MNNDYVIDEVYSAKLILNTNQGEVIVDIPNILPRSAELYISSTTNYDFNPRNMSSRLRTNEGGIISFSCKTAPQQQQDEIFRIVIPDEFVQEESAPSEPDTKELDAFLDSFRQKE